MPEPQPKKSLVDVLKDIESAPSYLGVDKPTLVLRAFDAWEKQSELVRRVRRGETTFKAQYEALFDNRDGVHVLYPHFIGDGREEQRKDATAVFGFGEPSYNGANFFNPVSWGGVGAAYAVVVLALAESRLLDRLLLLTHTPASSISRREFLCLTGGIGGAAAAFGAVGSLDTTFHFRNLKQNAAYLDEMHQKYSQQNRQAMPE